MELIPRVNFWPFVFRSIGQAIADAASWFGWDVKTVLTAVVVLALGLGLVWKVKGVGALQDELSNVVLLTIAPGVLFLAGLLSGERVPSALFHLRR